MKDRQPCPGAFYAILNAEGTGLIGELGPLLYRDIEGDDGAGVYAFRKGERVVRVTLEPANPYHMTEPRAEDGDEHPCAHSAVRVFGERE